ncbi:hypothetical protein TNCV_33731 [Trichonephila clavipes]|nr:hypothetical protein TNCV_33731 [Trichonephila clavipes]
MFRKWLFKNSDHFSHGIPRVEKSRRYNVFSVTRGSVVTACLEDSTLTKRPDRPLDLRVRQRDQRDRRAYIEVIRTSFSIQQNSNKSISVGYVVDEVDIRQLVVRIIIHVYPTLSMSEMRKQHIPTLQVLV